VERVSGDTYVLDVQAKRVKKYDSSGNPVNFTAGTGIGTNQLDGNDAPCTPFAPNLILGLPSQLAVDQSSGSLYVPDIGKNAVSVFSSSGDCLSQIATPTPSGVAIHPTDHQVYVTNRTAATVSVFTAAGAPLTSFPVIAGPTGVAVNSNGVVYVVNGLQTAVYDPSGAFVEVLDPNPSLAVAVDVSNDDVYVNEGDKFLQFDASGAPKGGADGFGAPAGVGVLANSTGIALGSASVYAPNNAGVSIAKFIALPRPSPSVDSQIVLAGVDESEQRHSEDFQVSANGNYAVFPSTVPLTGYDNGDKSQVFRYAAAQDNLDCVSCSPTGARPDIDTVLTSHGSNLAEDGRVFFTSAEQLVVRDSNVKLDAYEWKDGITELVSTGSGSSDSSLLSVSADGLNAFFFTRQQLDHADENGSSMRLYTARENGGFAYGPPTFQCAASDECHGPGSNAAPTLAVATIAGTPAQVIGPERGKGCGKGLVKRGGRCSCRHGFVKRGSRCVPRRDKGRQPRNHGGRHGGRK
jgi:hypothetical protein